MKEAYGAFLIGAVIVAAVPAEIADRQGFESVVKGMSIIHAYRFGTGPDANIRNIQDLNRIFDSYGIAGRTVINQEWQIYQPFNSSNFVFTGAALELTATIAPRGGCFPGGINSGQIWTKETYAPGRTGYSEYAIEVRMKIPSQRGAWPAAWLYTKQPGMNDGSEIDNPEFFNMDSQDSHDWTGFQHGPGRGPEFYSIKTNRYVWRPGIDFAADYHKYSLHWTTSTVSKYVDDQLVYRAQFSWTARGSAQLGVNLAVGTSSAKLRGLRPTSANEFPIQLAVAEINVWGK